MDQPLTTTKRPRIESIDALRGLVMVLMVLDHARDFFFDLRIHPEDLSVASTGLFFTRWITHFCAPTFLFLAGVSAWFYGRKATPKQRSRFLFTRGVWLLVLEFTAIHWALALDSDAVPFMFLVLSAIGTSMIALSLVSHLSPKFVGGLGIVIIVGHNALDPIDAADFGSFGFVWSLFHEGRNYVPAINMEIGYSFLPWFGIMAAGFGFGSILPDDKTERIKLCTKLGLCLIAAFLVVRGFNRYGNPSPWSKQPPLATATDPSSDEVDPDPVRTTLSFLRCHKYPPSLSYTLMTLGPALIVLALFEVAGPVGSLFRVYGRVPLFFYVVHFYIVHLSSRAWYWWNRGEPLSPFDAIYQPMSGGEVPALYGISTLGPTYAAWVLVILGLFPVCIGFGALKRRGKSALWSYL